MQLHTDTFEAAPARLSAEELLTQLLETFNDSADDYNNLADAYETQFEQLNDAQALIHLQRQQLAAVASDLERLQELQAQVDALREGNKLLMTERAELKAEVKKVTTAFDVAYNKSVKGAARIKELESELKTIKQHGDPKKLIAANKTLRDRNVELMKLNDSFKLRAIEATNEMERLIEKAGPSLIEPSFSKDGENIYLHPQPLTMERDGKIMSLIALTCWSVNGIGRVITWDQEKNIPHFASVGHKTVDAKLRPSQEALDWVCEWFRKNVQTVGNKQTFKTKYQIKGGKK